MSTYVSLCMEAVVAGRFVCLCANPVILHVHSCPRAYLKEPWAPVHLDRALDENNLSIDGITRLSSI